MNSDRLTLLNPFDIKQINMLNEFEKENEIQTKTTEFLKNIIKYRTKDDYENNKKNSNEIEESLFVEENNRIKDSCHIHAEKDIRICHISFAPIKTKLRNRRLLTLATEYAMYNLDMCEVFITIQKDDKNMIENLEARGFENLGEDQDKIIYLKEKVEIAQKSLVA